MRLNYRFFTERGLRVFLILPGLVGLAAFFRDIFLAILALGIGGFMLWYNVVSKVDLSQYIPEEVTQCPPPGRMVKN